MRDIYLHGAPGRAHGRRWRLAVSSPAEAVRALITLRPQLRDIFRKGHWRVIVGTPHIKNGIIAAHLTMNVGSQPIHIVPATPPRGSDIGDVALIVVGVVLIAAAIYFAGPFIGAAIGTGLGAGIGGTGITYGTIALLGVSLVASGIMGLLTPNLAEAGGGTDQARADDRPSFFFNGVTNNTQQGGPVPLVFGTHLVGSIVVFGSINTEQIPA